MNSEELELSLRTEFENYLKSTLARFRQEVSDIRINIEAEFDKHKAQIDTALSDIESRFENGVQLDRAFTESVLEHMRLARDEGAELAATAFGEAEKLKLPSVPVAAPAGQSDNDAALRDAINDISRQPTQAAILESLVSHAARFAPRGAFFIVKNDHFVGWRAFGPDGVDQMAVREIFFPGSDETIMATAVGTVATCESGFGGHGDDEKFLIPLGFGEPDRMVAVPLTARGRGVAVLYVDGGVENASFAVGAVESLVRVAGLTVELQASYVQKPAAQPVADPESAAAEDEGKLEESPAVSEQVEAPHEMAVEETVSEEPVSFETAAPVEEVVSTSEVEYEEYVGEVSVEEPAAEPASDGGYFSTPEPVPSVQVDDSVSYFEPVGEPEPEPASDYGFSSNGSFGDVEVAAAEPAPAPAVEPAFSGYETVVSNGNGYASMPSPPPVAEVAPSQPVRGRARNIQLPIDVSESERLSHNEAYSFARLLVSEIKLYNQQRVEEGRAARDLYDRLKEAIDRSREMYEKRVKPEVAGRYDYFDHMLVNNLADGDRGRLGAGYPGASV